MSDQRLRSRTRAFALLFLSALLICAGPGSSRADARPGISHSTWRSAWRPGWLPGDPETVVTPSAPGLFVALDPVTHRPTAPSDAQKRAFAAQAEHDALLAPAAPLQAERLPGGGEIIHLNGQFQSYSIARRDSRGRFVTDCAPDPATARKLLTATVREEK